MVLQEPFVQFLLGEVDHLAARFVMRNLFVRRELVQHTVGNSDIHAGILKRKDLLCRVNAFLQQIHPFQYVFNRFQFFENRFKGGNPFVHPLHES
jgi:hypothetical protein